MERIKSLLRGKNRKVKGSASPEKIVRGVNWEDHGSHIHVHVEVIEATPISWMDRFESAGNKVSRYAVEILKHEAVKFQTSQVKYDFILIKGIVFPYKDRTCEYVAEYGKQQGHMELSLYESCLLTEAIDAEMLAKLDLEWVMLMTGTILTDDEKEKLPLAKLGINTKLNKNKMVYSFYGYRPEARQNPQGLYAFIADPKHALK